MDKVVHFEIPAADVKRAQRFYKNVFGWQINPMPEMNYTILMTTDTDPKKGPKKPGAINGGMLKKNKMVKAPTITIDVKDIDAALELIEKKGGKELMGKTTVGNMGFMGYFKDSEGNVIGLWQTAKSR